MNAFVQEKTDARSVYQGTGLGMAIVKSLVDKMNGTISVTSKEGEGSTFVIRIPFEIASKVEETKVDKEKSSNDISGIKILLAEDNELNAEIAQTLLVDEGANVTVVSDGEQAVREFTRCAPHTYDVILMDIMMPVMNGYEAAKMIRSLDREDAKVIPIIAMTANAFTEDKMRAKEAGMDEHIAKPVDGKLLVKVISEFVENKEEDS